MCRRLVIVSGFVVLFLMGHDSGVPAQKERSVPENAALPTRRFKGTNGLLEFRIAALKSSYIAGEPVVVKAVLTNLSKEPVEICESCLAENVRIGTTMKNPKLACGWFADHPIGYTPRLGTLAPGETRQDETDVSEMPCGFKTYGSGKYKVIGSYCYDGPHRRHGSDPPLYCIDANELFIDFVAK